MSQAKKATYELYPLLTQKLVSLERDTIGRDAKALSDQAVLQRFARRSPDLTGDHAFYIMAEELHLKNQGSQVIFPDTGLVLDNLLKAKFSMETHEGFNLPYRSFLLAMPRGYKFNGLQLPSLLVTWVPGRDFSSDVLAPFLKQLGVVEGKTRYEDLPDMGLLSIVFLDRDAKGARSRSVIYGEDLPHLLGAKNPDQFHSQMVRLGILKDSDAMDAAEAATQFYSMRLVASLGVYHLATEGKHLKPGFPSSQAPRMDGRRADQPVEPLTLTSRINFDDAADKQAHFRSWHFRQLRDERYYRGEYRDHPQGSRYVFVSEAVIGLDATPNTQVEA